MKLKDIGVVVLSHGRRDKLEKSLKSYEENGLIDMVGDNFIFFNEVSSDDISLIENDYKKFEWGGHPVNCGIGWGMVKGITECNTKYVLFLENDFELTTNKNDIYKQLELGFRNLDKGEVDIGIDPNIYPAELKFNNYRDDDILMWALYNILFDRGYFDYKTALTPYAYKGHSDTTVAGGVKLPYTGLKDL